MRRVIMSIPALNAAIQGQGTVSADNLNTYVQTAQMAPQLRDFVGLPGMLVQLQGILEPNDGSGGWFYWNSTGTQPDDNLNYIVPTGTTTGEWERSSFISAVGPGDFTTIIVSGLSTLADVIIGGILSKSLDTGLIGSGSTQGTATPLSAQINIATTVGLNTGFILPIITEAGNAIQPGTEIKLLNRGSTLRQPISSCRCSN